MPVVVGPSIAAEDMPWLDACDEAPLVATEDVLDSVDEVTLLTDASLFPVEDEEELVVLLEATDVEVAEEAELVEEVALAAVDDVSLEEDEATHAGRSSVSHPPVQSPSSSQVGGVQ